VVAVIAELVALTGDNSISKFKGKKGGEKKIGSNENAARRLGSETIASSVFQTVDVTCFENLLRQLTYYLQPLDDGRT